MGARRREFLRPCFFISFLREVQSHLPESGTVPHRSNWSLPVGWSGWVGGWVVEEVLARLNV